MAPANMAARTVALLIDGVLVFFGLGELVALIAGQEHHAHGSYGFRLDGAPALLWLVAAFGYWIACECVFGATLGKRIFGIRVVGRDGGRPTLGQSLARNLLRVVDGFPYVLPYLIGFIVATTSSERRRLGDRAAGTRVVTGAVPDSRIAIS
jgi:uncharacterized RDD family membrane protein YckC